MNNGDKSQEIPLGLGMALAENIMALKAFGALSISEQQDFIENAHTKRTPTEMRSYVGSLVKKGGTK